MTLRLALACALLLVACGDDAGSSGASTNSPTADPIVPSEPATPAPVPVEPVEPTDPPAPLEPLPASVIVQRGPYQAEQGQDCDGYPALSLELDHGLCAGIVLTKDQSEIDAAPGRFRPRTLVHDPNRDDRFYLVDAGARRNNAGRLWRFDRRDDAWSGQIILRRLNRPHGSALGPDGKLYIGEMHRIVRVSIDDDPTVDETTESLEVVIDDLPTEGHERLIRYHPMRAFIFEPDGSIISNMGSATDRCLESADEPRCHDEADDTAALWRFPFRDGAYAEHQVIARGLRNSMALVRHSSGTVLQAENAVDFPEDDRPHEELNHIVTGNHYGWPYCFDRDSVDPRWPHADFDCEGEEHTPPHVLLPPHGAPLGMHYYDGAIEALQGDLLIVLHGYRSPGHRILAFDVDARGLPARDAEPRDLLAGWNASDLGPKGSPVDFDIARDGAIWLVEDKNGTVIRIAFDRFAGRRSGDERTQETFEIDDAARSLHTEVLIPRCSACHEHLRGSAEDAFMGIRTEGWLQDVEGVTRIESRIAPGASRPMPPTGPLPENEREPLLLWVRAHAQ